MFKHLALMLMLMVRRQNDQVNDVCQSKVRVVFNCRTSVTRTIHFVGFKQGSRSGGRQYGYG
jgi:hypothetical protein